MLTTIFVNDVVANIPDIVSALMMAGAAAIYFLDDEERRRSRVLKLIYAAAGFRILYAVFISLGQYYVWSQDEFTRLFLGSAGGGLGGYFLDYTVLRYWLGSVILTFAMAGLFGLLLKALRRRKESYFEDGEPELGVLMMLLVGWPEGVLFLALLALTVIFVSVLRAIVWRNPYTTLGSPFLIAAALTLLRGERIVALLGWDALRI